MMNLRSEKGSITLFVLISCIFFVATVACVQMYMQSKQTAVDREYRQIKENYEQNIEENEIIAAYSLEAQLQNVTMTIEKVNKVDQKLIAEFTLDMTEAADVEIKTIKYGWGTSTEIDKVTEWTFLENESVNQKMIAIHNNVSESGDYYLFVVINAQEICEKITI